MSIINKSTTTSSRTTFSCCSRIWFSWISWTSTTSRSSSTLGLAFFNVASFANNIIGVPINLEDEISTLKGANVDFLLRLAHAEEPRSRRCCRGLVLGPAIGLLDPCKLFRRVWTRFWEVREAARTFPFLHDWVFACVCNAFEVPDILSCSRSSDMWFFDVSDILETGFRSSRT